MKFSTLNPDRLKETQRKLAERIAKRFPTSGLSKVAAELVGMVEEAGGRSAAIRRPNWPLRAGVVLLCLGALGLGLRLATSLEVKTNLKDAMSLFAVVDAALRTCFFIGAAVLFLVSLEIRLKRRRALAALHELRAMAHVVEMHQIAKAPEGLLNALATGADISGQTTTWPLTKTTTCCADALPGAMSMMAAANSAAARACQLIRAGICEVTLCSFFESVVLLPRAPHFVMTLDTIAMA